MSVAFSHFWFGIVPIFTFMFLPLFWAIRNRREALEGVTIFGPAFVGVVWKFLVIHVLYVLVGFIVQGGQFPKTAVFGFEAKGMISGSVWVLTALFFSAWGYFLFYFVAMLFVSRRKDA